MTRQLQRSYLPCPGAGASPHHWLGPTLANLGWMIPQLLAPYVQQLTRRRPYVLTM